VTRSTRRFLLGGCALVLLLELPATVTAFLSGLRGPYAQAGEAASARLGRAEVARLAALLLLVRP
jgi:hypothetical protein